VRRFTAPTSGRYRVRGSAHCTSGDGDGVRALVFARDRVLVDVIVPGEESVTIAHEGVELRSGESIDFVVDCREHDYHDKFVWAPVVESDDGGRWSASEGFRGPAALTDLDAWETFAHALLMTNEFAFLD
jgi:hypothetical protein